MMTLDEAFNSKLTENGDIAFTTTGNNLLDILFLSEYYTNHLDKVHIGTSETEKLFSMMTTVFCLKMTMLNKKLLKNKNKN